MTTLDLLGFKIWDLSNKIWLLNFKIFEFFILMKKKIPECCLLDLEIFKYFWQNWDSWFKILEIFLRLVWFQIIFWRYSVIIWKQAVKSCYKTSNYWISCSYDLLDKNSNLIKSSNQFSTKNSHIWESNNQISLNKSNVLK